MLNLKEFHVLQPSSSVGARYKISVNKKGHINLNGCLTKELVGKEVEVSISTDGNILLLNPAGKITVKVPKSGTIVKCKQVLQYLKRRDFPVYYTVEWSDEDGLWVGKTYRLGNISAEK